MMSRQFKQCVPPCPHFIASGNGHKLCVICLEVEHTLSALTSGWVHSMRFLTEKALLPADALHERRQSAYRGSRGDPRGSGLRSMREFPSLLLLALLSLCQKRKPALRLLPCQKRTYCSLIFLTI